MECGSCDGPLSMQLLYSVICKEAPAVEHEEIKRVLGASMVEENEMLLEEYKALLDIVGEFENETEQAASKRHEAEKLLVPDRARLLRNIQLFLENIDRAATPASGRRPATGPLPLVSTPREQAVMDYVSAELHRPAQSQPSSPAVALAGSLRPGSARMGSTSRPLSAPGPHQVGKVRALDMETIKEELRRTLREENQMLLQQTEMIRLRLEDAAEHRHQVMDAPTPSVHDIKEFEKKLEKMSVQSGESLLDVMDRTESFSSDISKDLEQGTPLSPASPKTQLTTKFSNATVVNQGCNALSPIPPPPKGKKHRLRKAISMSIDCSTGDSKEVQ